MKTTQFKNLAIGVKFTLIDGPILDAVQIKVAERSYSHDGAMHSTRSIKPETVVIVVGD